MQPQFTIFAVFFRFLWDTFVALLKLPLVYTKFPRGNTPPLQTSLYDYDAKVEEVVQVIQNLKTHATSQESLELERAAQLIKKTSSFKELASMALPRTLSFKDTNRFTSAHWFSQSFPDLYWAYNSFRNTEFPASTPSQRSQIKKAILNSPRVKEAIKTAAIQQNKTEKHLKQYAAKIFENMASDFRMSILRGMAVFLRKVLRLLYPFGMNVAVEDLEKVKEIARRSNIVYLPCHKSYIDFLVVTYICFSHGLPLPHVVSGDNLNLPIVGKLLRFGGAFFIRRTFGNDELYRTIFNEYVRQLLITGNCVECFIEGGRSRSGKVLPPKPGFLRVIVDTVADGDVDDVHIIPISLGYDKVLENDVYIKELTGGQKKAERLFSLISSSMNVLTKALNKTLCLGQITIGFGEPISVKKFLSTEKPNLSEMTNEQRKQLTKNLGYRTLYEINYSSTILTATLVGTVLLTQYGRGIRFEELLKKVKWLRKEVLNKGGRVQQQTDEEISASLSTVVENVLESSLTSGSKRNRLVKKHKDILMLSLYSPPEQMELALYRNQLIHYFVSEGVLACAFYACEKESTATPALVSKADLVEKTEFLSKLLKLEFVYKPSPTIHETLDQTLSMLMRKKVFEQASDDKYSICEGKVDEDSGTTVYLHLCSLFWSFIESYWLAGACLLRLLPNRIQDEGTWIRWVQDIGERLYFEGMLDLYEAISQETLQNALTLYESWKMIQFLDIEGQNVHNSGKRIIQLTPDFRNNEAIEAFAQKLGAYRKRVSAYRSRRYKVRKNNYIIDAIQYIKMNCNNGDRH